MSGAADIRAAIVAVMAGVDGIGVVQPYERYAKDLKTLAGFYQAAPGAPLCGWFVRRLATTESGNRIDRSVEQIVWRIQGFMALDDAAQSELAFDALIEALRDAFRDDETLGGTVAQCSNPDNVDGESGLQLDDAGPVMFGGVLCHACRLRLTTVRYLGD